jgi:hypothetical protein
LFYVVVGITLTIGCGLAFTIHFVGDRIMVRRGDMPIVTPAELRVWMMGAIVGIAIVAYTRNLPT